jgi:predicted transcriptional regulator
MNSTQETLKDIASQIEATGKPRRMTVRGLLAAIGQERRGKHVSKALRTLLRRSRLKVEPDFDSVHIDAEVTLTIGPKLGRPFKERNGDPSGDQTTPQEKSEFAQASVEAQTTVNCDADRLLVPQEEPGGDPTSELENAVLVCDDSTETDSAFEEREVIVTVRQGIPALAQPPLQLRRNEAIFSALTQMNDQNLALLIVTNGTRGMVEGILSWQSYGKAMLSGKQCQTVGDCLSRDFGEVREDKPLFDAVREVIRHGVVVVRARDGTLCGVVTQRDAAEVFVDLAEPFLFLGQIENHLRELVKRMRLPKAELLKLVDERDAARADRTTKVDNLTLGELIRAIENPANWDRLGLNHDRTIILQRLHRVRDIRNKVMHFDADPLLPSDKSYLTETRRILQEM